jgi:hypothetical protein
MLSELFQNQIPKSWNDAMIQVHSKCEKLPTFTYNWTYIVLLLTKKKLFFHPTHIFIKVYFCVLWLLKHIHK